MSHTRVLANRITRTFTGPMWHGPSLSELLAGVTPEEAVQRPTMSVHNIWELVLHIITWIDVPLERLAGSARNNVPADEDWPPPPTAASEEAWRRTVADLEARHARSPRRWVP